MPKVQSFCQHYGTVILPTKPYMPRHKGKVEAGVKYVKNNALKGRHVHEPGGRAAAPGTLGSDGGRHADSRHHQAASRQGLSRKSNGQPCCRCRPSRSPYFQEAQRKVNRDGHVEVAKAYYSAPPEYLGRTVWVRWDARLVRIFNHRWEQVALHVRHEPGRFSTHGEHLAPEKISGLERGAAYLLGEGALDRPAGPSVGAGDAHAHGASKGRAVLQGLLSLTKRHTHEALEKACETALSHGAYRLRTLRKLLDRDSAAAKAAAVSRRASDHPPAGRLRPSRRPGDPSPGRSLIHERRF